jgi:hypothetical protein
MTESVKLPSSMFILATFVKKIELDYEIDYEINLRDDVSSEWKVMLLLEFFSQKFIHVFFLVSHTDNQNNSRHEIIEHWFVTKRVANRYI